MSKQGLTPKREKFAQLIAAGTGQADAYRKAFRCGKSKDKTVHEEACRLAANPKVAARIAEIRGPVIAKVRYELQQAMVECDEAIALAKKSESASAMVAAVQLKAKLNGLLVEDRVNKRRPLEDLSDAELDERMRETAQQAGVRVH